MAKRYRSLQLQHTIRMMIEGIQYGGGMTDLLNQIAKDIRNQQMVQKEISGQLFMYTIFIAFAALHWGPSALRTHLPDDNSDGHCLGREYSSRTLGGCRQQESHS